MPELIKKILVPLDGSDCSMAAAQYAIKLARLSSAEVMCIHAVASLPYMEHKGGDDVMATYLDEAEKHAEMWYNQVKAMAANMNIEVKSRTLLNVDSVVDALIDYAKSIQVDLIVIGTKGKTGLKRFLLGSVASGIVSHSHCPVLVV
jgi:nucleotide-binding universal stress UspA family protein